MPRTDMTDVTLEQAGRHSPPRGRGGNFSHAQNIPPSAA